MIICHISISQSPQIMHVKGNKIYVYMVSCERQTKMQFSEVSDF